MFASVRSTTLLGVVGRCVDVEVHVGVGLPGFTIVGQPDEVCRESRDRVRAAFLSRGFAWPNRRITVNLAPSGERKGGSGLDLAIAVAVLIADEQVVLAGLGGGPLTFDQLVERLHLPIAEVALRLGRLEAHGWVVANAGWWEALVGG